MFGVSFGVNQGEFKNFIVSMIKLFSTELNSIALMKLFYY